jgi:hypothetical protein
MSTPNFSALLPDVTLQQLEDLKPLFNGNKTQLIMRAVAELHKREMSHLKRRSTKRSTAPASDAATAQ